jgi:hypothetical protein
MISEMPLPGAPFLICGDSRIVGLRNAHIELAGGFVYIVSEGPVEPTMKPYVGQKGELAACLNYLRQ